MISIVVPAFDEAGSIGGTVTAIRGMIEANAISGAEIVVVDDGSRDATARIAQDAGAVVVRRPHNLGYGSALKAGIEQSTYDTIVIIDADLTYPVDAIPTLLSEFAKGFDMVV